MHFLARNTLKLSLIRKKTTLKNHKPWRVGHGLRSELCLTLKLDHGVRESAKMI